MDGDGDVDVLSVWYNSKTIAWYENDGSGSFGAARNISTDIHEPQSVFAADLDGDGDLDVLFCSGSGIVAWHENLDGAGNFGTQQIISTKIDRGESVFAADLDGDGDLDVLSASFNDGKIAWYENNSTGGFGAQHVISARSFGATSVFAADIDGDGNLDVLSASYLDDTIAWYKNNGTGGFGPRQEISTFATKAQSVFAADIDGDGDLDVLSASNGDNKVAWYENDGAGGFGPQRLISTEASGAQSLFAADVDDDGDLDVISASADANTIAWYENDGAGGFGPPQLIFEATPLAWSVFAADIDGDGDLDVLSASRSDNKIAWYPLHTQRIISTAVNHPQSVRAADMDGDGDLDVLCAAALDSEIVWFENDGMGGFGAKHVISTIASGVRSVFAADIDGDGDLDALSASYNDDTIAWYENIDSGGFGELQVVSRAANGAFCVFAADLDGDGHLDVLSASSIDDKIAWYKNNGTGSFGAQRVLSPASTGNGARSVFAADLNGDGHLDVLSASENGAKIAWFKNNGTGGFGAQQVITDKAVRAYSVFAADLDGDGSLDVLSASLGDHKIAWYRNNGTGGFGAQEVITDKADGAISVFAADMDGDGDVDVISASQDDNTIAWYENNGTGGFGAPQVITKAAKGARAVVAADIDGGGALDVLSASQGDDKIAWYSLKSEPSLASFLAISVWKAPGGNDASCGTNLAASRPCASVGAAMDRLHASSEIASTTVVSAVLVLSDGGLATGAAPVVLAPPAGVGLLTVQVDEAGAELVCPGAVLASSCVTIGSGVALVGGPLTVSGGRSSGNGGCVSVRADRAPTGTSPFSLFRTPLFGTELLGAFELRGSIFRLVVAAARSGLAAGLFPAPSIPPPRRPAESSLVLRGCRSGGRGGGLAVTDTSAGGSSVAVELGHVTVEGCASDTDGGGISILRAFGGTLFARPLVVRNCTAAASGGGLYADTLQPLNTLPTASVTLFDNTAADCGAVLSVTGSSSASADLALADLRLIVASGSSRSVCASQGARVVLPECDGARESALTADSRFGAVVVVPHSCPPSAVTCFGGEAKRTSGSRICSACARGRALSEPGGGDACTPCAAGRFAAADGEIECAPCSLGTASESPGAVECSPCPRGEFANTTGLERCLSCDEGRFQPDANSTVCLSCGGGSFSNGRGSVQCVRCPPGRASATSGSSVCLPCGLHTFASTEGLRACEPCNATEHRFADREGAQLCDLCDRDKYLSFADRSVPSTFRGCLPCPAGASCASGQPLALASAWVSPLDAATGESRAFDCLPGRCLSARECLVSGGGALAGDVSCCAAGRRLPAAQNPLCGACEAGKEEWGGECVPCTETSGGLVLGYLALGVLFLLALQHVTANSSGAALSKVAIGFAQVAYAFFADEGDESPVRGGAVLSFDPLGLESSCVAPMSDLTRAVLPLVQLLLVCVLFVALGALNAAWWSARGRRTGFRTSPFARVLVALAVFGYFPVFRTAVNLLRCVELPGGARVLRQFPTVSCESAGYRAWVGASWTLASSLLAGLASLILAYGRPRYLAYWPDGSGAPDRVRKIVERRIGFLHLSYRGDSPLAASWEVAVLVRSSVYVAAAALGGSGDSRFALLALVSLGALMVHLYVQPFRRVADNRLETVALASLAVIGSLNNSGWRGASGARTLTSLLFYGLIAGAALLGVYLKQGRLRTAVKRISSYAASASARRSRTAASVAASFSSSRSPSNTGGASDETVGCARLAAWLSRFFCWHLPPAAAAAPSRTETASEIEVEETPAASTTTDNDGQTWTIFYNEDGVPYYSCAATGKTQWERPT